MGVNWSGPDLNIRREGRTVIVLAADLAVRIPETALGASERLKAMVDADFAGHEVFFSPARDVVRVAPLGHVPEADWWLER